MRENFGFILACSLLFIVSLVRLHESHFETVIFDGLPVMLGACIAAVLFFVAFFRFFKHKNLPIGKRLTPMLFWICAVGVVAAYDKWLNRIDYAPNFMHISSGSDFNIDGFTLKEDGRYIYWNGSGLGESRNYGTYQQNDSIIVLSADNSRNAMGQMRLLIRPYRLSAWPAFTQKSKVFLIDRNGKTRKFDNGYNIIELQLPNYYM